MPKAKSVSAEEKTQRAPIMNASGRLDPRNSQAYIYILVNSLDKEVLIDQGGEATKIAVQNRGQIGCCSSSLPLGPHSSGTLYPSRCWHDGVHSCYWPSIGQRILADQFTQDRLQPSHHPSSCHLDSISKNCSYP